MKWVKGIAIIVVVSIVITPLALYLMLRASLPDLDGDVALAGLSAPVSVERDALGVPTLGAENELDLMRALGFVHAQERFFQMDLMRRRAAGELAELFGGGALDTDLRHRVHRMRPRAEQVVAAARESERETIEAYADGVNGGLAALGAPPFEYLLLGQDPRPWSAEDSVLVIVSMYFELNDAAGRYDSTIGLLRDVLPAELAEFLSPWGTDWDTPVEGEIFTTPSAPSAGFIEDEPETMSEAPIDDVTLGSNNWAVAGTRTTHGGALLANDMHLAHSVPNIWYRAMMISGTGTAVGVTLPGVPFLVAGSNTHIAWGFTNTNGDWVDLVELEMHPDRGNTYRTPDGWARFDLHEEVLKVADGNPETLTVRETIWGPVIDEDHQGTLHAVRWIAHELGGLNMELGRLQSATTLDEALAIAQRSGMPPQNFVCADDSGAIAWTIAGRIPRRFGFDGRGPSSWADGARGWDGWLEPEEYPVIRNPDGGLIWTANARVVGGDALAKIGDGGYDIGTRARQIRDDLLALDRASERDMLDIQLDDRAQFMETWRDFFLDKLDDGELRRAIDETWTGRASTDSVGYRIVRELRVEVHRSILSTMARDAWETDRRFDIWAQRQWEGPVWRLVTEQPEHLLPSRYESWDGWINAIVQRTVARWDVPLETRVWGESRMSEIRHPLSRAIPFLSRWLDMPSRPLPGDTHLPRVQGVSQGASERLVVSPGREEDGLFHMPGGQSGHPLSRYYGAGHEDWEEGRPTPLLPGQAEHTLTLH